MARAFVSRNYAFIIQNAFYATKQTTPVPPAIAI